MSGGRNPGPAWPDEDLVAACLGGSDQAWNALVDKYKKLVWAIIVRYGIAEGDSADVFQAVWFDVYGDLDQLRNRDAVKPWLISLVRNKCYHSKKKSRRREQLEVDDEESTLLAEQVADTADFVDELERQQVVREAISRLNDRCREMVELLFFHHPPLPYTEVAQRLGLAVGSIGFIRGRCLKKLQKALEEVGVT